MASRPSELKFKQLVWELQDLMDIPREVRKSKAGNRYEYPKKGWEVLQAIVKVMVEALHREETIQIRGFGTFKLVDNLKKHVHKPFLETNPKTGKVVQSPSSVPLPERKKVIFIPSVHLQAMINPENPNMIQRRAMKTWKEV